MGNACNGGPLHIISNTERNKYKPLKIIDFCSGHYPLITSGAETFTIHIPSIDIEGMNQKTPAELWVLKNGNLIKE